MTAKIIRPEQWRDRFEVRLELLTGVDYAGLEPMAVKRSWEVGLYRDQDTYVDPLAYFEEGEGEAAAAWAEAYAADRPNHVFKGIESAPIELMSEGPVSAAAIIPRIIIDVDARGFWVSALTEDGPSAAINFERAQHAETLAMHVGTMFRMPIDNIGETL